MVSNGSNGIGAWGADFDDADFQPVPLLPPGISAALPAASAQEDTPSIVVPNVSEALAQPSPAVDTSGTVSFPVGGPLPAPYRYAGGQVAFGGAEPSPHSLGATMLLAGGGAAVGLAYGGPVGMLAGALLGGATMNGYRAARSVMRGTPEADREALISGTYAVVGLGLAGYLAYRAYKDNKANKTAGSRPATDSLLSHPGLEP